MHDSEQALLRRALIGGLTVSVVAAPGAIGAAPAAIGLGWVVLHAGLMASLAVGLWCRWCTPAFSAAGAALVAASTTFVVARAVAGAVTTGEAPAATLAMVTLTAAIGAGGVAFLAVRSALAVVVGLTVLASQAVAIRWGAGVAWRTVLGADAVAHALRFGVLLVVMFGLISTIAERRGAERDLAETEAQRAGSQITMERGLAKLRQRALAEASHELKNPLTVVRGSLELLLGHNEMPADQRRSVEDALWRALHRLEERTHLMLPAGTDAAMARTHDVNRPERLHAIAERAQAACEPMLAKRLVWNLPDLSVTVSPTDADHVLENLLSNAFKYGPPHDAITVSATAEDTHARLVVHDRGTSLTSHEVSRMFEHGFRSGSAQTVAEGSGVGLSLVSRLVRGWGGHAGCEVDAAGTRVWVTMPMTLRPVHTAPPAASPA
ncbi:MAG: signal transduction histidine kinase [Nitriliruptoraceae bacterium]